MTLKTREYLKLAEDYRDYPITVNEETDRINLLTEENQVLFEQITLLRAHVDYLMSEYGTKTEEATHKIAYFDRLERECETVTQEKDTLVQSNTYLESRIH